MGIDEFRSSSPRDRRRLIALALVRASVVAGALVSVYYLAPLDRAVGLSLWVTLGIALMLLAAATVWQLRALLSSDRPGVRAIEGLASTLPLFLLIFAASYFLVAAGTEGNFNVAALSRTDALYFTVTVFTTVGFGDITATGQLTRVLVTVQMLLDLIVLGLVIRVFFGAVQTAWRTNESAGTVEEQRR